MKDSIAFMRALPVWPRGRREKMNDFVLFRGVFQASAERDFILRITASTYFRAKLNRVFLAHGPMRGPKGFFRIAEIPLAVKNGENLLEIEVSGANVNSFDYMDQPSFLQAEVVADQDVVLFTGENFAAFDLGNERIRKVSRLCYQRMFLEAYRVTPVRGALPELELEMTPPVRYLPSTLPQPEYRLDRSYRVVKTLHRHYCADGALPRDRAVDNEFGADGTQSIANRALTLVGKQGFKGFEMTELEVNGFLEIARYVRDDRGEIVSTFFEGKINNAGFPVVRVRCRKPGRLVVLFDEKEDSAGGVDALRLDMCCAVFYDLLQAGEYELETLEPYALKCAEIFIDGGEIEILDFFLREFKSPLAFALPDETLDAELQAIYHAGCETFAANAVDVLTDCPSRERGGYIGDSFFTARAALTLTSSIEPERFFLENYLLAPPHEGLPPGAFPMEYPGDHPTGQFIPNWGMWLILQLEEFLQRSKNREMIAAFREKVFAFIGFIDRFLNGDGLLENLPSWVFVEWSRANYLTQDVNYPSNMLYARALDAAATLYDVPQWHHRAVFMREKILSQSFDGEFFRDHAVRGADGTLSVPDDRTEICQYYAFFFGVASPETHPVLWRRLVEEFGPRRMEKHLYLEIAPANMIMGNYLRLALLVENRLYAQALDEIRTCFLRMAQTTGTLWEHNDTRASCCHGIASFISHLILTTAKADRAAQRKRALFERQKSLLDTFLANGAIDRRQYEKSSGCLCEKMGIGEVPAK